MKKESRIRSGLRISTIESIWATIQVTLTTGAFLTGYALWLGVDDFQLALLTSIPLLAQVFQVPGAYLVEKTGHRKRINSLGAFVSRLFWLPMALVPLWKGWNPISAFMALYAVSSLIINFAGPAWVVWMTDLVPLRIRGRYFGNRNKIVSVTTVVAGLTAGAILDFFRDHFRDYDGYFALFALSVAAAVVAYHYIRRQPEPGYSPEPLPRLHQYLIRPMRDANYGRIMIFYLYWILAVGFASPFFTAHLIRNMQWNFKMISLTSVLTSLGAILFLPAWGRALDRFGHKPILITTCLGILHLPVYYAVCPYNLRWPIYAQSVLAGAIWAGFNLAMSNLMMSALPRQGRPGFVAVYAALTGMTNFISSLLGGLVARYLTGLQFHLGGLVVVNYQVIFVISALLRIPGVWLVLRIHDPGAERTIVFVREAFNEIDRLLGFSFQFLIRPARMLSRKRRR